MRSQVQVLAGPPPIPAGHSAVGSEPGTPAASLGRVGAARPPRRHAHRPRQPRRQRPRPPRTVVAHPAPDGSHTPGAATSRRSLLPCPRAAARHRRFARRPSLPGRSACTRGRCRAHPPGQAASDSHRPPRDLGGVARALKPAGRRPSRSTARQPPGPRQVPAVTVAPAAPAWSQRLRPVWEETDASGPTGGHQPARHRTAGHQRAGRWTGGHQTAGPPDPPTTTPGDRTPDGWTPDPWTTTPGWVDTACWTPTGRPPPWRACWQCRPRRRCPTLDAGWTLRRADAVWADNNQASSAARATRGTTLP
jgi:hypothetical protein